MPISIDDDDKELFENKELLGNNISDLAKWWMDAGWALIIGLIALGVWAFI